MCSRTKEKQYKITRTYRKEAEQNTKTKNNERQKYIFIHLENKNEECEN
jgi:hypothetical protein